MSTEVLDRVEEWDTRSFTGGGRALQRLVDREFSGVVRADDVELFMTRGVAVAVRGGDVQTFENTSGTVYEAPSPALPLLAVMQEQSNEVRDRFYTEQTPISTVDETLSAGGFTGYIELSENVLSGDYYLVYHAGESTSVAFVGQSGRLVRGSEAFEAADNEVGIYQVRPVDIHPVELPEPEPEPEPSESGAESTGTAAEPVESTGEPAESKGESAGSKGESAGSKGESAGSKGESAGSKAESAESKGESAATETEPAASESGRAGESDRQSAGATAAPVETGEESTPGEAGADPDSGADSEARVIPSVDPARTAENGAGDAAEESSLDSPATPERPPTDDETGPSGESSEEPTPTARDAGAATSAAEDTGATTATAEDAGETVPTTGDADPDSGDGDDEDVATGPTAVEQLEQRLDDLGEECEALRERLDELQTEREELREQLAAIQNEHDEH